MLSINTSPTELILLNSLNNSTHGLNKTIERLTTGYKINHAKDNAAGISIVTQLSTKISSLLQIKNNTEDGISLLSTAQGALEEIQDQLARLRELSTQAMNGTYDEQSRKAMQAEADAIIENIKQIRNNTEFNGLKLFESNIPNNNDTSITANAVSRLNASAKVKTMSTRSAISPMAENDNSVVFTENEGAITFAGKETKTLIIQGVSYTITNRNSENASFSFAKDQSSGQITFIANGFTITGQENVRHNLVINGTSNYVYGGKLNDTLQDFSRSSSRNRYYGGDGDDTIILRGSGVVGYGENGNDTITTSDYGYQTVYGGDGDDIININKFGCTVYGENGNDTFNINSSSNTIYGGEGDDVFNFISNTTNNIADGGSGNNVGNGTISKNDYATNMSGQNCYIENFTTGETKDLTINGINYNVKATRNNMLIYKIDNNGAIIFKSTNGSFTITGQADKAHNVIINSQMNFYGGDLADNITVSNSANDSFIYGMGGDDTITNTICSWVTMDGGDGNDTIINRGIKSILLGGNGNDTLISYNYGDSINAGAGDDNITLSKNSIACSVYGGGSGNNTLTNNSNSNTNLICGFGSADNSSILKLAYNETKDIEINGITYTVKNTLTNNYSNFLLYNHNPITNEISLSGNYLSITGQTDAAHNVILGGTHLTFYSGNLDDNIVANCYNTNIYGGSGNDYIEVQDGNQNYLYGQNYVYGDDGDDRIVINITETGAFGGNGNDTITLNKTSGGYTINGGNGDDTYNINAVVSVLNDDGGNNIYNVNVNNSTVTGGEGNDTFYINGSNNNIITAGGDDYIVLDGNNNNVDGGTGTNYYINNGVDNTFSNVNRDPNSGMLIFTYVGEVKTFEMDGVTYTVTNQNADGTAPASNTLKYSYNPQTKTVTLNGSDLTVGSNSDTNKLNIRGDNNTINGGNGSDIITIEQGSNNIINGLGGDDTLIMNSENNSLNGGDGNDTITLNASTDKTVTGGNGNDIINISSSNNTDINSGNGDDKIIVKGENNIIDAAEGNNSITINGANNEITAENGNNKLVVTTDNNNITLGNGSNSIGIQGNGNTLEAGNASGDINIVGNNNDITVINGNNNINIKGNENSFNSESGNKIVSIDGNTNSVQTGSGNDEFEIRGNNNIISSTSGDNKANLRGDENTYQGGDGKDNITISGNRNQTNGGDANDEFMVSKGNGNIIDGETGDRNTMINNGVNTQFTNVVDITPRPFELGVKVDLGTSTNSFVNVSISFNLFDFYVDFMSGKGLAENIEKIDDLLSQVETQLMNISTSINRLTAAMEEQGIQLENMISTRSTFQDADIAKESSNFIKYQILQQASATLCATANQSPSIALQLI